MCDRLRASLSPDDVLLQQVPVTLFTLRDERDRPMVIRVDFAVWRPVGPVEFVEAKSGRVSRDWKAREAALRTECARWGWTYRRMWVDAKGRENRRELRARNERGDNRTLSGPTVTPAGCPLPDAASRASHGGNRDGKPTLKTV